MERTKINKLEEDLESSTVKSESNDEANESSGILLSLIDAFFPLGYALSKGIITTMALKDTSKSLGFDLIESDLPYLAEWIIGLYGYASAALEAVRFWTIDNYVINNIGPGKHYKSVGGFLPWEIIGIYNLVDKIIRNK